MQKCLGDLLEQNNFLIDAEFEIEILGFTERGVNMRLRLRRNRQEGLREDCLSAMFAGVVLKEEEYPSLQAGSIIVFNGIKVQVKVEEE